MSMKSSDEIIGLLSPPLDKNMCLKLIDYYDRAKTDQFLGRWDDAITKYGKFIELSARLIYVQATNDKTEKQCRDYTKLIKNKMNLNDSLRLYVPNAIDATYDIRNNRDAAHSSLEIEANQNDCIYTSAACDWILTELLIAFSKRDRSKVSSLISSIVTRKIPFVFENSEGRKLVPNTSNPAWLNGIILLYNEKQPMSLADISYSIRESKDNIKKQFNRKKSFVYQREDGKYEILPEGMLEVEKFVKNWHEFSQEVSGR